jgi:carboxymethylenebutenolidase
MCFDTDARPPLPPIHGGAIDARSISLTSRDGTAVPAYAARAERPAGAGIVVIPDVRGLHPYYEELALRFAEAGVHAVALDLYARSADSRKRGEGFEHEPHVRQLRTEAIDQDVAAAVAFLRSAEGGEPERIYTVGFCLGGRVSHGRSASTAAACPRRPTRRRASAARSSTCTAARIGASRPRRVPSSTEH